MKNILLLAILIAVCGTSMFANFYRAPDGEGHNYPTVKRTEAHIMGHVTSDNKHIPFASISIKGTTIGTLADESGHFMLEHLPEGDITLIASVVGFKPMEKVVNMRRNQTMEIAFVLEEDVLDLNEVVVSANRDETKRSEAPVIVTALNKKLFNVTQSSVLGDALNFCPGLRMENNCQNCGFTQVRMNGMEGPYSQILINSRPIFSGLAGVYGLELIPSNMIEKVEVVRGGGSALFGSNAIAGTINILLKDPIKNSYEMGTNYNLVGFGESGSSTEYSLNFNASVVKKNQKSGMSVFGFTRNREIYDANSDGLSEISPLSNLTLGSRLFYRFGSRNKLTLDFFTIEEKRDGGNMQHLPLHEREVAEAVSHDLKTLALTFEQFVREYDLLSVYASGQYLNRDSYYGANMSLSDYGNSVDRTYNIGVQYKLQLGTSTLVSGIENTGGFLVDSKLGYPDYDNALIEDGKIVEVPHIGNTLVSDQASITTGVFSQYDIKLNKTSLSVGARFDHYRIEDYAKTDGEVKIGNVFSPRLSVMQEIAPIVKGRLSYSQGYRAPQIFDEDLHIETSGSRQVINVNDPKLKQETSHSITGSLDFNKQFGKVYAGLLIEGFYTRLQNPFVNEIGEPDEDGTVLYTRMNADEGAVVNGVNFEFKLRPSAAVSFSSGFTVQTSRYDLPQEFNETRFFKTPDNYGYFTFDWTLTKSLALSTTGNYTGSMLIPYFGPNTDPVEGELRNSDQFFDFGLKLSYTVKLKGVDIQGHAGVKNLFNSFQTDFDIGPDRDPAYMYGPMAPRTIYVGLKFGNIF